MARSQAADALPSAVGSGHPTSVGDFSSAPRIPRDLVHFSAFAPGSAAPRAGFLVQALVHLPEQADQAALQAAEADDGTRRRGRTSLATEVPRGATLTFELSCRGAGIDEPRQSLVWRGETGSIGFFVTAPAEAGLLPLRLQILQDTAPIGQIRFTVPVQGTASGPRPGDAGGEPAPQQHRTGEAVRYRTAFASYATPDRGEVVRRVQALRAAGIHCFQDVLDLEPGQRWEQQLWKRIDQADVLFLFWSDHAKASRWVAQEWKYGLEQRGLDFIRPVILQREPFVSPPDELRELHFNDHLLSLIDS
ncbi:MAG: toll/interleukin-1 receptor domain-containing protein [Planctomycetia bacterium]|nr:toll/interleukin-1 receptor domain-containing protein [Planctomycetia bacterium]